MRLLEWEWDYWNETVENETAENETVENETAENETTGMRLLRIAVEDVAIKNDDINVFTQELPFDALWIAALDLSAQCPTAHMLYQHWKLVAVCV